jgi:hypothetical protein
MNPSPFLRCKIISSHIQETGMPHFARGFIGAKRVTMQTVKG